jgi:hypothetical protein
LLLLDVARWNNQLRLLLVLLLYQWDSQFTTAAAAAAAADQLWVSLLLICISSIHHHLRGEGSSNMCEPCMFINSRLSRCASGIRFAEAAADDSCIDMAADF